MKSSELLPTAEEDRIRLLEIEAEALDNEMDGVLQRIGSVRERVKIARANGGRIADE